MTSVYFSGYSSTQIFLVFCSFVKDVWAFSLEFCLVHDHADSRHDSSIQHGCDYSKQTSHNEIYSPFSSLLSLNHHNEYSHITAWLSLVHHDHQMYSWQLRLMTERMIQLQELLLVISCTTMSGIARQTLEKTTPKVVFCDIYIVLTTSKTQTNNIFSYSPQCLRV